MTEQELKTLGNDCYAAFNSRPPEGMSRAWTLWAEMCRSVELQAAAWIRSRLIEQDTLPRNFGKAVLTLYREWRAANGKAQVARECCPDCDAKMPGFFYAWRRNDVGRVENVVSRCMCNEDIELGRMLRKSKVQMQSEGWIVMPQGYRGNVVRFEMDNFPMPEPEQRPGGIGARAARIAKHPPEPERPRQSHANALAEAEIW